MLQINSQSDAVARRVAHYLLRDVNRAVREFDMIRDGDRIAVAVSGSKDSLALLRLLLMRRASSLTQYELAAVHVRVDAAGVTTAHTPLETWLRAEGVPYRIVEPLVPERETLAPYASYFGGHFRLIRPLIYVPEKGLARLARAFAFPPPPPACLRQGSTARHNIAKMLELLGRDYVTQARPNLIRAGLGGRSVKRVA